jgi:acyl carrier protein
MLDQHDFVSHVIDLLEIERPDVVTPNMGLFDDLGLDSLQAFQLLVVIESLAGVDVPPPELPAMYTMQDAYDYYRSLV